MKLDKKSILYFGIVILTGLTSLFLIWHFSKMPEIKEIPPIEKKEEVIKEETMEEILERLAPKEERKLTEEEKKEIEKTLKELTPTKPKPMTEKEREEMEELLKKLTP